MDAISTQSDLENLFSSSSDVNMSKRAMYIKIDLVPNDKFYLNNGMKNIRLLMSLDDITEEMIP